MAEPVVPIPGGDLDRSPRPRAAALRDRLGQVPTGIWVLLFTVYAWLASTVCAAWFLRRMAARRGEAVDLFTSLAWQGANYGIWLAVGGLVWLILRRLGAGTSAAALFWAGGLIIVPLAACGSIGIDLAFSQGDPSDWVNRAIDRAPIDVLFYTAVVCVGFAASHRQKAFEAREHARSLEVALAAARSSADQATQPRRLMVMTGARRTPVDLASVEWFASAGNYVVVHWETREGLLRETLRALEGRLDPALFARSHRSTIVNLARVRDARPLSDGSWRLTMQSGAELVASRTWRDDILNRLRS